MLHAGKLSLAIMLLKATCRWTTLLFVSNVSLSVTRRYARSNNVAIARSNLVAGQDCYTLVTEVTSYVSNASLHSSNNGSMAASMLCSS